MPYKNYELPSPGLLYTGAGYCHTPEKSKRKAVSLYEFTKNPRFNDPSVILPLSLGRGSDGKLLVIDLADLQHLLVAGACGSGKAICMQSFLTGLLLSRTPEQLKLILMDQKKFEYPFFSKIRHLATPVLQSPEEAVFGFRWAIDEMNRRRRLFEKARVSDIKEYNARQLRPLPYLVIVVDDLGDLHRFRQEIDSCIVSLSPIAPSTGIHMILATQRPDTTVISDTITNNIPGRIAFQVARKKDSRTILGTIGAEKLLGSGDMLYLPPGKNKPVRVQGTFTSSDEMQRVTNFIQGLGSPKFTSKVSRKIKALRRQPPSINVADGLIKSAIDVLRETKCASTSSIQSQLKIGYSQAALLLNILEEKGIIGPPTEVGPRKVLLKAK